MTKSTRACAVRVLVRIGENWTQQPGRVRPGYPRSGIYTFTRILESIYHLALYRLAYWFCSLLSLASGVGDSSMRGGSNLEGVDLHLTLDHVYATPEA